jgi:hypothetical protein
MAYSILMLYAAWVATGSVEAPPVGQVPEFVARAAAMGASDVAYALSEAHIPAGVVLPLADLDRPASRPWRREEKTDTRSSVASVSELLARASPGYRVQDAEGVLLVRGPGVEDSAPPFAKRLGRFHIVSGSVSLAFAQAQQRVNPTITGGGGELGSVLTPGDEPPLTTEEIVGPPISMDLANPTLVEILNEIVWQAPGTVWMLASGRDNQGTYYQVALRRPRGRLSRGQKELRWPPGVSF